MEKDEKIDYRANLSEIERVLKILVVKIEQEHHLLFKILETLNDTNKSGKEALAEFKKLNEEVKKFL